MDSFDLRELRYFVAVAEELNFSRAAQRLGMAQPPLSRAIRQLERKLGVELLIRNTHSAELTDSGRVLLEQGSLVLDAAAAADRLTRRAAVREQKLLVALTPDADGGLLKRILDLYHADSVVPAEVRVTGWGAPEQMVRDGRADVAIVRTPTRRSGLHLEPLLAEPRLAVLAEGHPLADKDRLTRADLAAEVFPEWEGADDFARAYWSGKDAEAYEWDPEHPLPGPAGAPAPGRARTSPVISDLHQLFTVVAFGQAVALLPQSIVADRAPGDVVARPVDGLSASTVSVAWLEASTSKTVAAFLKAAMKVAEDGKGTGPEE
ncbi:LysR family transcriptional regulator [Streptomyces sp. NPDC048483]|uniref:LysR family transcriptional regulator n=1 Tax=Streptomyces sp. NPDC048483 TaxID=3154927 RepID=UPI00343E0C0C